MPPKIHEYWIEGHITFKTLPGGHGTIFTESGVGTIREWIETLP